MSPNLSLPTQSQLLDRETGFFRLETPPLFKVSDVLPGCNHELNEIVSSSHSDGCAKFLATQTIPLMELRGACSQLATNWQIFLISRGKSDTNQISSFLRDGSLVQARQAVDRLAAAKKASEPHEKELLANDSFYRFLDLNQLLAVRAAAIVYTLGDVDQKGEAYKVLVDGVQTAVYRGAQKDLAIARLFNLWQESFGIAGLYRPICFKFFGQFLSDLFRDANAQEKGDTSGTELSKDQLNHFRAAIRNSVMVQRNNWISRSFLDEMNGAGLATIWDKFASGRKDYEPYRAPTNEALNWMKKEANRFHQIVEQIIKIDS